MFVVIDGALHTHPANGRILEGITRNVVIELAKGLGIPVKEQAVAATDLASVDECFITGTGTLLASVMKVDEKPAGNGNAYPIAKRLWEAFKQRVL